MKYMEAISLIIIYLYQVSPYTVQHYTVHYNYPEHNEKKKVIITRQKCI